MKIEQRKLDPVLFAVIKARLDGIINEMTETMLRTSRNPILNLVKDFTCSILTYDVKLLTMARSLPIHILMMGSALPRVVECFEDDIHPGDCFGMNDPYYGGSHIGDFSTFAPIFCEGELICWVGTVAHWADIGCYLPTSGNAQAKDVYEEGLHFPPLRMVKDYEEISEIIRFMKANLRYPEQWHGDFLAQIGSLFVAEREIIKLCKKYGGDVLKQFQNEFLDYGDGRVAEEIKKLPKGTWSVEALSEKIKPWAPEGLLLKLKMSIVPDEATIIFDLTEMPDQLPWGYNVGEACARGACIEGALPSLDPTLPKNDGVYRHFKITLREGAVVGIPKWPAATATSTYNIADQVANMVLTLWEQVEPGRGHAGNGEQGVVSTMTSGIDFRHNNAPYGATHFLGASGGGASKGCDGWPNWLCNAAMGNMAVASIELAELAVPQIVRELRVITDSGGAGKWRGAPGFYRRIQPRHHTMTAIAHAMGLTSPPPLGVAGGKCGTLGDHWLEKHGTGEKAQQLYNAGVFYVKEDQDWVLLSAGGGGYGDPLERDPEAVRDDARNYLVSVKAARNEYGVVLNTEPELYEVEYEATEKLRAQLRKERETK